MKKITNFFVLNSRRNFDQNSPPIFFRKKKGEEEGEDEGESAGEGDNGKFFEKIPKEFLRNVLDLLPSEDLMRYPLSLRVFLNLSDSFILIFFPQISIFKLFLIQPFLDFDAPN